ncbi:MAG: head-tail connector protein [Beijerinckiaceae bacterium]|jgi:uncharacterized phiE125 gp8 family phage protein|nr:head-tail connector protein [Beijerinckiaceae bacterium]
MIPLLVDGPQLEPVSLAEAKGWLRVEGSDEDSLIQALIIAARLMVESEIGLVLLAQNWRIVGDSWPACETIPVPIGRVLAVTGGRVFAANGSPQAIPAGDFEIIKGVERDAIRPNTRPAPGRLRAGIEIDLRLGFGEFANQVPDPLRLAMRQLIAFWYDNRGDATIVERGLPAPVRALLKPFRRLRLGGLSA